MFSLDLAPSKQITCSERELWQTSNIQPIRDNEASLHAWRLRKVVVLFVCFWKCLKVGTWSFIRFAWIWYNYDFVPCWRASSSIQFNSRLLTRPYTHTLHRTTPHYALKHNRERQGTDQIPKLGMGPSRTACLCSLSFWTMQRNSDGKISRKTLRGRDCKWQVKKKGSTSYVEVRRYF